MNIDVQTNTKINAKKSMNRADLSGNRVVCRPVDAWGRGHCPQYFTVVVYKSALHCTFYLFVN